jgi:hypothetical protein
LAKNILWAILYGGAFYLLVQFLGSSPGSGMFDKHKFEIKRATDIQQRLDDIKGIDEIKEEI